MKAIGRNGKAIKKELAYSMLTDRVFWIDGKGDRTDVTQGFLAMIETWANEGSTDNQNCERSFQWPGGKITIQCTYTDASGTGS